WRFSLGWVWTSRVRGTLAQLTRSDNTAGNVARLDHRRPKSATLRGGSVAAAGHDQGTTPDRLPHRLQHGDRDFTLALAAVAREEPVAERVPLRDHVEATVGLDARLRIHAEDRRHAGTKERRQRVDSRLRHARRVPEAVRGRHEILERGSADLGVERL